MGGNGDLAELREGLTESERLQIINGAKRLKALGYTAQERGLRLLCDAEYTYMNPGISALVIAMALVFNESSAVVSNTYQCYLKVNYLTPYKDYAYLCHLTINFYVNELGYTRYREGGEEPN